MKSNSLLFILLLMNSLIRGIKVRENLDEIVITSTHTLRQLSSLPLSSQLISKNEI